MYINKNLERTSQHKCFQLNDLSNCSFQLQTCQTKVKKSETHQSSNWKISIYKFGFIHVRDSERTQKFWFELLFQIYCTINRIRWFRCRHHWRKYWWQNWWHSVKVLSPRVSNWTLRTDKMDETFFSRYRSLSLQPFTLTFVHLNLRGRCWDILSQNAVYSMAKTQIKFPMLYPQKS